MNVILMTCPFPPCRWYGEPITQQARFGDPETNQVLPIHDVVGEAHWFGRCPGSMLIVPELSAAGERVIADAMREYSKRKLAKLKARVEAERAEAEAAANDPRKRRPGESYVDWLIRKARDFPTPPPSTDGIADLLLTHGPRVDPRLVNDDYFPGRPADAPEPGIGDPPDTLPAAAAHADITPLGKAGNMDNARDNLKALITLVILACDDLTTGLGQLYQTAERAHAREIAAETLVQSARGLAASAVGAGGGVLPDDAQQMIGMLALTESTISGHGAQSIIGSIEGLKEAISAAMNQTQQARQAAERYRALP